MSGVVSHSLGNKTQILGSEGTIILEDKTEEILFAKKVEKILKKLSFEDPNASLDGVNKGIWNVSVVSLLEELTSAIKENRSLNEGSTFEDGLKNQLVVDAVFQSTKERKWIDL